MPDDVRIREKVRDLLSDLHWSLENGEPLAMQVNFLEQYHRMRDVGGVGCPTKWMGGL